MATISGIDLRVEDIRFSAGAAFRLSKPARINISSRNDDGNEVFLQEEKPYIVVLMPTVPRAKEFPLVAYEAAQHALDLFSIEGFDDLTISGDSNESLMWWREKGQVTLLVTFSKVYHHSSKASVTVTHADGTVEPHRDPVVSAKWHEAFRYFRLSQTTDDLFDSYRNLYLAFEAIVSTLVPMLPKPAKGKRETETRWLMRALTEFENKGFSLQPYVNKGVTNTTKAFYREQYKAHRCAIFHAKTGEKPILPGSLKERSQVKTAHERLTQFLLNIIKYHKLAPERKSGGITTIGFGIAMQAALRSNAAIAVREKENQKAQADIPIVSPFLWMLTGCPKPQQPYTDSGLAKLPTKHWGTIDQEGREHALLGRIDVSKLSNRSIYSIVSIMDAGILHEVEINLSLDKVDVLEVAQTFTFNNPQMPKSRFLL